MHPVQVSQWKKKIQTQCKTLFEGKLSWVQAPVVEHNEPERLYSEICRLKIELEWLKNSGSCLPSFESLGSVSRVNSRFGS